MQDDLPVNTSANSAKFPYIIILIVTFLTIAGVAYYFYAPKLTEQKSSKPNLVFAQNHAVSQTASSKTESYFCPIDSVFCKDKDSFKNNMLQAKLDKGADIYAAFDGDAESLQSFTPSNQEYKTLIITNSEKGLIGYYYFNAGSAKSGKVARGEVLGKSAEPIAIFDGSSFAFQLIKMGVEKGTAVELSLKEFN